LRDTWITIHKPGVMKKRTSTIAFLMLFILYEPLTVFSQEWGGSNPKSFMDHWAININAGLTSYFGDLSYYDADITGKLNNESGPAFGALLTKYFNNKLGVSGQILYGNFNGGKTRNFSNFTTNLIEYNIQAKIDFVRLIFSNSNPKIGIEGFAGIGQLWFSVAHYEYNEGIEKYEKYESSTPEFVYFGGMGTHYHIADQLAVTATFSIKQMQNDRLDNLVKNSDYDFYTYSSFGITYYIKGWGNSSIKNKARLAHSGIRSF